MPLSETTMQIIWIAGMILIPIIVYFAAKHDIQKGFHQGADSGIKKLKDEVLPEIEKKVDTKVEQVMNNAIAKVTTEVDGMMSAAFEAAGTMLDEKIKDITTGEAFHEMGNSIGEAIGNSIGTILAERAAKSRAGSSSRRKGGGAFRVGDILGGMVGGDQGNDLSEMLAIAQEHPEFAGKMLAQHFRGNGGDSNGGGRGVQW